MKTYYFYQLPTPKEGDEPKWGFTSDPNGGKSFEGDYEGARAYLKSLNDAVKRSPGPGRTGRPPEIKEGTGKPRSVNIPDALWDALPEPRSVFIREAIRAKLKNK